MRSFNRLAHLVFLINVFAYVSMGTISASQDGATIDSDACADCHDSSENGTDFHDDLSMSVHDGLECLDCHTDKNIEPHHEDSIFDMSEDGCGSCHDDVSGDYHLSIHYQNRLQCFDCHSKHRIQPPPAGGKQQVEFCLKCHNKSSESDFKKSIHYNKVLPRDGTMSCTSCHNGSAHQIKKAELSAAELHETCAACHNEPVRKFEKSLHGKALSGGKFLAPDCITCHGNHAILSGRNEDSKTYVMNIPALCGDCHKDGGRVSELESVSQRHVLEDYTESIHGDGLFKRGLTVTAVCVSCHYSHNILPHEDPESSINRNNIAGTCRQCHSQIEKVHQKVIRGELWEKQPHMIPVCIDCHQPHKVRRVFYEQNFTDDVCMKCHGNRDLSKTVNGEKISLYVNIDDAKKSAHANNSCIKCHTNISESRNPVCLNSGKVDCSICHSTEVEDYSISQHGTYHAKGNPNAPYCTDCHGTHDTQTRKDLSSPIFTRNIPNLCGRCHNEGQKAAVAYKGSEHEIIKNYTMSIHGKGLLKSGLMVTATCIDCHTSHREMPASDPRSTVNRENIPGTCGKCHLGIYEQFKSSVHSPLVTKTDKTLPDCKDCHQSHTIERVDEDDFRQGIMNQCGKCHLEVTLTYFDTFHGKVSKLGAVQTAKCYDCHGSHQIHSPEDPNSTLSHANVVETCKKCHPNSNRKFVGYLTHATHHDKEKYPFLYYTFWFMTILLTGTFSFFGLHTLLWLPRALAEKRKQSRIKKNGLK